MRTLVPWRAQDISRWRDVEAMERRMRRMFGRVWPEPETAMEWMPVMDLKEMDGAFELTAELPGLKPEEVELNVEENVLTIRGENKEEKEKEEEEEGKRKIPIKA